jgi:hypothetical protein
MELSDLVNGVMSKPDTSGVDLYYGVYGNKLRIKFPSIGRVRYHDTVEKFNARLSYVHPTSFSHGHYHTQKLSVADYIKRDGGNVADLIKFINWRNTANGIRIVLNLNVVTLYYNDCNDIKDFVELFQEKVLHNSTAYHRLKMPNIQRGVLYQKRPKHKWRIYLKSSMWEDAPDLSKTMDEYQFYPCPMLRFNLVRLSDRKTKNLWIYESNFIDCDDEGLITIFALKYPNAVKKVYRIESR